ncbi:uncharacterized protein LOC134221982 [Armigeres subalbatus]|uniref:uncharacterized protein LOC134221982 n=1 Tax=Armigeres subalbatus TaxID=124917 RepID=UPI002ED3199B
MEQSAEKRKNIGAEKHSEKLIQRCIEYVRTGKKTLYTACKMLKLPLSTIRYRLSGRWKNKNVTGPRSVLSAEEEHKIVQWLIGMQQRGFPVSRRTLVFKVAEFLTENPRETPFKNNRPGRKWFKSFMRRNPGLSLRTPEAVSSASSRVSEEDIKGWFQTTSDWLEKENLLFVLEYPERVFNGDETSFYLHPKSREVIAKTGSRNVYEVEQAPGRGIGQSERGWMDVNKFRQYIHNIFHPYLVQHNVELPVVFFVDGHASHTSVEVADLCQSLGIILISLYPNTTHITQPADVAVFKPLKDEWRREVEQWRFENQENDQSVTCTLQTTTDSMELHSSAFEVDDHRTSPLPQSMLPTNTESSCESTTLLLLTAQHRISIDINKIVQAVDMIGSRTLKRIQ